MTHTRGNHRRSPQSIAKRNLKYRQKRFAKKYIFSHAYHDRNVAETVNRISSTRLQSELRDVFQGQPILIDYADDLVKGEILADSRGKGSFQHG